MHGICRLSCQKSERIPFVAARCILFESAAERTSESRILGCSAFIFADKNGVVIVGALINCTVCNALLYELIVNTTPEKILQNSVAVLKLRRQEKHLWLIFFLGRWRRFPVRQHLSCKNFHGFYEVIFLDFYQIVEGRIAAETSRPPIPFAVGNL